MAKLEGVALITGASGFIGNRLREALLDRGMDVVALVRAGSPKPKRGRSVVADYADKAGLAKIVAAEKPAFVFHVAGATKGVTYDDFYKANVMPTANLADAILEAHPTLERFLLVSSLAAWGPSKLDRPHRETDTPNPIELYGRSKLEAERELEKREKLAWTAVRPGGVYGPGDVDYFELFKSVTRGINLFFGNRHRAFSAIYVDDLVRAILVAATSEKTLRKGYFIADGAPITWGEFQEHIVNASGRNVTTLNLPEIFVDIAAFGGELLTKLDKKPRLFNKQKALMGAQEAWTGNADAFTEATGFRAEVMVPEGVKRALDWYKSEKWI